LIRGNRALKKIIKTSLEEILNAELTGHLGIEKKYSPAERT
jgi:transposase-like protein